MSDETGCHELSVPGRGCVGVGVGAVVFDAQRRIFLARRGPEATNETGAWEFPGGTVMFGECLEDAVRREFLEEYGMEIAVTSLLGVFDHILPAEEQHWVSVTYLADHVSGTPRILEPQKCTDLGWFDIQALPAPLTVVSQANVRQYLQDHA